MRRITILTALLLAALLLFSACNDTVSTEPEGESPSSALGSAALPSEKESAGGQSDFEEAPALHFNVVDAAYFYLAAWDPDAVIDDLNPWDGVYFKSEAEGRTRALININSEKDFTEYNTALYGKGSDIKSVTLFGKDYELEYENSMLYKWPLTLVSGAQFAEICMEDCSSSRWVYNIKAFSDEDPVLSVVEIQQYDHQIGGFCLPAEEVCADLPPIVELTLEEATQYAEDFLLELGYPTEGFEKDAVEDAGGIEGITVSFTDDSVSSLPRRYIVTFEHFDCTKYPETISFMFDTPFIGEGSAIKEFISSAEYEETMKTEALLLLSEDLKDASCVEELRYVGMISRPCDEDTLNVLVVFDGMPNADTAEVAVLLTIQV